MDGFDLDDFSESYGEWSNDYHIEAHERLKHGSSERSFWLAVYLEMSWKMNLVEFLYSKYLELISILTFGRKNNMIFRK